MKFFEFANLGLPMAGISAAFGPLRLTAKKKERLYSEFVPWALRCGGTAKSLITVYWEKRWDQNVEEMKKELGIWDPPEARWSKPLSEAKAAAAKRQQKAPAFGRGSDIPCNSPVEMLSLPNRSTLTSPMSVLRVSSASEHTVSCHLRSQPFNHEPHEVTLNFWKIATVPLFV